MDGYIQSIINDMKRVQSNYGEDSLSVEEALNLPTLKGSRLIAGASGLQKRCKHLTILETPTGINWLEGEEFLVTAGYAFINDEELKKNMLFEAHNKGVSAIAIKENRYFGEISKELIEQANEYEIPIILLPHDVVYTRTISSFYNMLFYRKNEYILNLNNIYEKLLNLSFENKDIDGIIYSLSELSNSNIFLFNNSFKAISNRIINDKNYEKISDISPFNKTGKHGLKDIRSYIINKELNSSYISIYPIIRDNKNIAYLFITNDNKLDKLSQSSIEYGISIISIKLEMENINQFAKTKFNKTLVEIMLNSKDLPDDFYQNIERDLGWITDGCVVGICIRLHIKESYNSEDCMIDIYNYLNNTFENNNYLSTNNNSEIFIYIKIDSDVKLEDFVANLYNYLKSFKERFNVSIGIANLYKEIRSIEKLRNEAHLAAMFTKQGVIYYNSLDTIKLLYPLKDDKEIQEYYGRTIKKLEKYDESNTSNLIKTLETYFRYSFKKNVVSEKLYIHVETLRYRLNKIEEITGYSLSDAEGLFALQMGIKLRSLIKINR